MSEINKDLYLPQPVKIVVVEEFTDKEKFFRLELLSSKSLGHIPCQFVLLMILGIGEAPISISSPPTDDNTFEICVRRVGTVTNKLHTMKVGDILHIRGPFGRGIDAGRMKKMHNKHLLFVDAGLGYVPLRSFINKVLVERDNYKKISILYGVKHPSEWLYKDELDKISKMGGNIELLQTVDVADKDWKGNVGVITTLIPKVRFDPKNTIAIICGPPVMYKYVVIALKERHIPEKNIYMSLERRMRCGIGKCGHCQMENAFVCKDGPLFNYADIVNNEEVF